MAVVASLVTVAFLTMSVITTLLLRTFLSERLDQQLVEAGDRFAVALPLLVADDTQFERVPGQSAGTLGARVLDGRVVAADVVARGNELTSPGTGARAQLGRLRNPSGPRTLDLVGLGSYRVVVQRGAADDLLVTGLPLEPVDDTIDHVIDIQAVVFGVVLLATLAIATLSVRRSFRPLEQLTATAVEVAQLPLSTGQVALPSRTPVGDARSETGRLSAAMNGMLDHVETSLRRREAGEEQLRRFVADASHELRTPVATVRARAEQALDEYADGNGAELERVLRRIDAESERMGRLVEDLLTLARLDAEPVRASEPVDLTLIVLEVVEDARLLGAGHRWELDLPAEPLGVLGDPERLRRVVVNLVANAAAHTGPGTTVTVSLAGGPDGVRLTVADDGPGIPEAIRPTVFERFVHGSAEAGRGSGLGLAIVHAIVTAHRGRVSVSTSADGTSFLVELPAPGRDGA